MSAFEMELPGVFFDALIEDEASEGVFAVNLSPHPDETGVHLDAHIELDVICTDAVETINGTDITVYVDGIVAFTGGGFQVGFDGPDSAFGTFGIPENDVIRITIDRTTDFDSLQVVEVRVVAESSGGTHTLDQTYEFTCADATPPVLLSAEARELQRVRIIFDEPVKQEDATEGDDALNPANWELELLGSPGVQAVVVAVESVTDSQVDLITDIPLSPGIEYRVYATNLTDVLGNVIVAPFNQVTFLGWQPDVPAGRNWDLWRMIPAVNREEDITGDLLRFIKCLQEPTNLLVYDIDRFTDILDPDFADEQYVDAMLADLGNPFDFDLELVDKRRLIRVLVQMYQLKGTDVGIKQVILFFMGIVVDIDTYNNTETMILGESELGFDWILGAGTQFLLYSFQVISGVNLTDEQREQLTNIVEYMKPAHTHFVRLVEPATVGLIDHLELGFSELGDNWLLH